MAQLIKADGTSEAVQADKEDGSFSLALGGSPEDVIVGDALLTNKQESGG